MLKRVLRILKANGNDMLDIFEEPKKILKQTIREFEDQKIKVGEKCIQLNAKVKELERKLNDSNRDIIEPTLNALKENLNLLKEKYLEFDGKIEEYKSKALILEAKAELVETTKESYKLLKELNYDLDTSTFKRMEEKILKAEDLIKAEQEFFNIK